jgi:hypothetical protein
MQSSASIKLQLYLWKSNFAFQIKNMVFYCSQMLSIKYY